MIDPASPASLAAYLDAFKREAVLLSLVVSEAQSVQWDAAPVPTPRDDTTERSQGGPPNDPTSSVALDERRLRVREDVAEACSALEGSLGAMTTARRRLESAVGTWAGNE